jgi:hypothetical protein
METTSRPIAHASAVSGILNRAGFRKCIDVVGFETIQIAHVTQVWYTPARTEVMSDVLDQMDEVLKEKGYTVRKTTSETSGSLMLEVTKGEDTLATEEPVKVTVREVRQVLLQTCYEVTTGTSGFNVQTFWSDKSLIRVSFELKPWTTFEDGPGAERKHIECTLAMYEINLNAAGYATERLRDSEGGLVDAILVGPPGTEFYTDGQRSTWAVIKEEREHMQQQTQEAQTLTLVREAIENDDLAYSTRKAGPWSIFVLYLVPFKNKVRRAEVSFDFELGGYVVIGRLGFRYDRTFDLQKVLEHLRDELKD